MLSFQGIRTASAAELNGQLDTIADAVFGQPNLTTGMNPAGPSATTLSQADNLFVFDTGQIFIADTGHNRVLGWHSVDSYTTGDPADLVLGQPDFTSANAPNPPTALSMNGPTGITMGRDGTLYVSDTGNHRVLAFDPINLCDFYQYYDETYCKESEDYEFPEHYIPIFENNMAATIAIGQPDMQTGGLRPTSSTSLNYPTGITLDLHENLIVADTGNNRVLMFEWPLETGMAAFWVAGQDLAGATDIFALNAAPNPPTDRSMNGPTAVAQGNLANELYVADTGNNRILVYTDDPIDYIADAVIGQPDFTSKTPNNGGVSASSLSHPTGLKMDAGNRLFVADRNNHRVLIFDRASSQSNAATAVIGQPNFTSNGSNQGGISGSTLNMPTGVATDAAFMDVYIADRGNNRVLQYFQPLPNPAPVIGELDPGTVRVGSQGFTLKIWGTGIISETVVEINGSARVTGTQFLGVTQVPISAAEVAKPGNLVITLRNPAPGGGLSPSVTLSVYEPDAGDDEADNVLGQEGFTTDNGAFEPVAADTLWEPIDVVTDPNSGRVFVADSGNSRILSWPSQQAHEDGAKADLVIGQPDFQTVDYDGDASQIMAMFAGLALDSQGNLYASDAALDKIQIYKAPFTNGMAASVTIEGLHNPLALLLDAQDNLYVADALNHRVLFYEKPLTSGNYTPDRVYGQADFNGTQPNRGGMVSASSLNFPAGLAIDSNENLYVADSGNHRVLLYTVLPMRDSTADRVFGQPNFTSNTANNGGISASSLNFPFGLAINADGDLWVADRDNNRVLRFDDPLTSDTVADVVFGQDGSFTQNRPDHSRSTAHGVEGPSRDSLKEPLGIHIGPDGYLFVSDFRNNRVLGYQTREKLFLPNVTR